MAVSERRSADWGSAGAVSERRSADWGSAGAVSERRSADWGSAGAISGPPQMKGFKELNGCPHEPKGDHR